MDPVVASIFGFEDQLVKIDVVLKEGEPASGNIHVSMGLVVPPIGVGGLGDVDVCGFSHGVLAGVHSTCLQVQYWATIAAADDDGLVGKLAEWLKANLAKLLQTGDKL